MGWLRAVLREILGLFIDDGSLALAAVIWLVLVWLLLPLLAVPPAWRGVVLFAGLALALVVSCRRAASR